MKNGWLNDDVYRLSGFQQDSAFEWRRFVRRPGSENKP
jgi:hypothetical protein